MASLTANVPQTYELGARNEFPVAATTTIYEGAAVGINLTTGYARPLTAGDPFGGFAEAKADNAAGAAGDKRVRVIEEGKIRAEIANAAITDIEKPVYMSDDHTFTFTATGNSYVGRVSRWVATGVVMVTFEKDCGGVISALTDNTNGTASATALKVMRTDSVANLGADVADNIASLGGKVNAILQMLK